MRQVRMFATLLSVCLAVVVVIHGGGARVAAQKGSALEQRVAGLLARLTLEEKIDLIGGDQDFYIRAVPRLGIPAQKMADGPLGVRNYGPSTAYAAGIALAAAWDTDLAGRVGEQIGADARARGVHYMLGPGLNIYRAPMNGRNFEYFGEDPFLASSTVTAYVLGMQSRGVAATVKHYLGNNQEFDRHHVDSVIDERTMREIYLPAFEAAVGEAGVGAIMTSYNPLNGVHASQHDWANNQVARRDWRFDGLIMSDWGGTYDGVAAANGGLDLEMPSGRFMNRETLLAAIKDGRVSVATIDEKVRRILRNLVRFGWLDRDQADPSIPLYSQESRRVALESALGGMVLLRNEGGMLPLDRSATKTLLVVGPNAHPTPPVGGGSGEVRPFSTTSYMQGLSDYLGMSGRVLYHPGVKTHQAMVAATEFRTAPGDGQAGLTMELFDNEGLRGAPTRTRVERRLDDQFRRGSQGTEWEVPRGAYSARWSGVFVPSSTGDHLVAIGGIAEGRGVRLFLDDQLVIDDWDIARAKLDYATRPLQAGTAHRVRVEYRGSGRPGFGVAIVPVTTLVDPAATQLAQRADAVVVCAGFDPSSEGEGADRTFALPPGQDALIEQMAAANPRTIVVVTAGGGVDMRRWGARVPALLQAWYAGQEGGRALPLLLFGDVSPSGRLPISMEARWEDSAVSRSYYPQVAGEKRVTYSEGLFVGYRHFDRSGIAPAYPFGFGLTYSSFRYSNLAVLPPPADWRDPVTVSFDIANTGSREAAEVAQVYVAPTAPAVPRPPKELKGFVKVRLRPGETRRVTVSLERRAFCYWDVQAKRWRLDPGEFGILVGRSSAAIELRARLEL